MVVKVDSFRCVIVVVVFLRRSPVIHEDDDDEDASKPCHDVNATRQPEPNY